MSRLERKNSIFRKLALLVVFNMAFEIVFPTVSLALTSGPSSPEFGSFEPVATNNMVDPFSGDFTYNLPVLIVPGSNGGGYPISLSYHSGTTGEQEASWVGHGWTLNPGAINRGKQGFPDDWNGEEVVNHNKSIPNITVSAGANAELEAFSINAPGSVNAAITYNNYKGIGYSTGAGLSLAKGFISLGFNITDGQHAFSLRVNPWKLLNKPKEESAKKRKEYDDLEKQYAAAECDKESKLEAKLLKLRKNLNKGSVTAQGAYGVVSLSGGQKANQITDYTGGAFNFSVSFMSAPTPLQLGPEYGFTGSVSVQSNIKKTSNKAYGNYYNANAYGDESNLMDYYTEKQHAYENNDIFLGIPHAMTDQYMVSGEGAMGGFRLHQATVGQFRPNRVNSEMIIGNLGLEFGTGLNTDFGMDIGAGYHSYVQKQWELYEGIEKYGSPKNHVFRFSNDLGGSVTFDDDQVKETASLYKENGTPGFKKYSPNLSQIDQEVNTNMSSDTYGIGALSYIGHTIFEEKNMAVGGVYYNAYEKSNHVEQFVNYAEPGIQNQIAELSVKNGSGETYNYGLPVFAREEKEIAVGLTGVDDPQPIVENGYMVYTDADVSSEAKRKKLKIIQGQERQAPYVTSYLLTSIYEPNYIDRTNDGPTQDDFGGYTKFEYKQAYGSDGAELKGNLNHGDWYQWRFPYTGLYYDRGRLSDKKDDMGSYSSGEKEVYYLDQIETKTHIAVFETSDRMDGLSAADDVTEASTDDTAQGSKRLQKLDKIELFVKDADWHAYVLSGYNPSMKPAPLKTVNFEYDYSLVPGIPNSDNGEGKLTLKRVWFDYNGIYKAQISPYEFDYNYPNYTTYPAKYTTGVDDVTANYENFNGAPSTVENPAYHEQQLNAWGYNQTEELGKLRHDQMNPWPDQRLENGEDVVATPGTEIYDPAAWNLKAIKLPSGGEIHVQYEQDDYQYVQDKVAHVMVPLTTDSDDDNNSPRYYLDAEAIGVTTPAEKQALVDAILKIYVQGKKKIYFKMLYSMTASNIAPSIDDCDVEYIKGYINVANAQYQTWDEKVYIDLETGQNDRLDLPKKVCKEYDKAFLSGKELNDNCGIDGDLTYDENDPEGIVASFLDLLPNLPTPGVSVGCLAVDWENSYFRVPCIKPKKGGGLRVKRLMMYTPALHAGEEPQLYGTEYIYKFRDTDGKIKSSGVATNEPAAMREENILVDNIDRLPKNQWDKLRDIVVAGKEKEKFEGPIGEALYGSASVGYSQVVTRSIHSGETNTGFSVSQYYTCKDFPLVADYTDLAGNTKKDYLPIPALWVNNVTNNVWAAQGYHFTVNNMHGQMRRVASYTGGYTALLNPANANLISATEYDYFEVGENVPVMNSLEEIVYAPLGKESEMFMESRSIKDHLHDVSAEFDASVGIFGAIPIPMGSLFPSYTHIETELHTHVTNKITRYPAIVKSTRNYTDGVWSKTAHLAFNSQTGEPLISRTYDDFNESNEAEQFEIANNDHHGWLTSYAIPAYKAYRNMDQTAISEGKTFGSGPGGGVPDYNIDKLVTPPTNTVTLDFYNFSGPINVCVVAPELATGDLIQLIGTNELYHIESINGNEVELVPTYYNDITPTSATDIRFKVIRSGRTNQAGATVGSFVTYGKTAHPTGILPEINVVGINDPAHPQSALYSERATFVAGLNGLLTSMGGSMAVPAGMFNDASNHTDCWDTDGSTAYVDVAGGIITLSWVGPGDCVQNFNAIPGGQFLLHPENGGLFYGLSAGDCNNQVVECFVFCEQIYPIKTVGKVITASALTLSEDWDYDASNYDNGISDYNDFESGKRGKWRLLSNFGYKSTTTGLEARFNPFSSAVSDEVFNYNSGIFDLELFNWKYLSANNPAKWLKATTITKYSPNGNALEEENILGIKSTVKFGYNENLPYLVAGNAPYESVAFESFENVYNNGGSNILEENLPILAGTTVSSATSHTGYASLTFAGGSTAPFFTSNAMPFTDQVENAGLHTKLWIKNLDENTESVHVTINDVASSVSLTGSLNKVAQTGEWTLYEINNSNWGAFNPEEFTISFHIENGASGKDFYVDDIRIQPIDAEMSCHVYDYKNFRLLATFGSQHFSMRYQYNDEGQLIRKQIETMRGIKTITDGQYNTPVKNRTN